MTASRLICAFSAGFWLLAVVPAFTQELEPRAYSVSPVGTSIYVLGYGHTSGAIVFDPALPVEDAKARIHGFTIGYARSLNFFGRSANFRAALPYAVGHLEGRIAGEFQQIYRSGLADVKAQFSVNLFGAPAMRLREFAKYRQHTNIATSIAVSVPSGQYDPARLINIGANRVAVKPEIAISQAIGKWYIDGYAGVWFFTNNERYYPGSAVQKQAPISTYQGHLSYTIRPRFWAALDATYYGGGNTTVDGQKINNNLSNSRVGMTVSIPLAQRSSLKLLYAKTALSRIGGRFDVFQVGYAFVRLGK